VAAPEAKWGRDSFIADQPHDNPIPAEINESRPHLGLYIHVPFCSAICNYCNFNRGLFDASLKARYVAAVLSEIARAADGSAADTIFLGGGTPSVLEPSEIQAILDACRASFVVSPDAEVTMEANPETVTPERLTAFRDAGINRLSFGVQSFRDDELRRLSRLHSASRAQQAVGMARAAGFTNLSLDLRMWLPQQTVDQWLESVEGLLALEPEHASLYLLELYPNAPLRDEMARGKWSLAPDDDAADMYLRAMERLESAGYAQYEISNVSRPGFQSRHNLKYWTDGEWLGFGPGAHSTRGGVRWKNVSATEEYVSTVAAEGQLAVERLALTPEERLEDALFTGLRLSRGLDLDLLKSRYCVDIWARYATELQPFVDHGLLIYDGGLRLTRAGMLLAHEVMAVFINSTVR
jgi:oxygen-independent coproporphyrinogen-3 oxidase